jgi:hypothetical protein
MYVTTSRIMNIVQYTSHRQIRSSALIVVLCAAVANSTIQTTIRTLKSVLDGRFFFDPRL